MAVSSQTSIANRRDYDTTFTAEYDANQTNHPIITPSTGKRLQVVGLRFSTEKAGSAGQYVKFSFETSVDTLTKIFVGTAPARNVVAACYFVGGVNEPLSLTTTIGAGNNIFVAVNYKEV